MAGRNGFTLVELVVVVLILGILAAIAVPKIISNADDAMDSSVAQTLASIRDAVELYNARSNGLGYPDGVDSAALQTQLAPYIRGTKFPKAKVGGLDSSEIKIDNTLTVSGSEGWIYAPATGDFIINTENLTQDGVTKYSEL